MYSGGVGWCGVGFGAMEMGRGGVGFDAVETGWVGVGSGEWGEGGWSGLGS